MTEKPANLRQLRFFLLFSAFAWGISVVGVFAPWSKAVELLQGLGAREIPEDPMLEYWLRMASGAFFLVGIIFSAVAWHPGKHEAIIPWLGWMMIVEGLVLLVHGLRLRLTPLPFYADTAACFIGGLGILRSKAKTTFAPCQPSN